MSNSFYQFTAELERIKQQSLYRQCQSIDSPQGVSLIIDGRQVINFCSNDYLGLANHPLLKKALQKGVDDYGLGSGSAHLICGHSKAHKKLEEELAAFTGRERVLLYSTGYMANLGVISALMQRDEQVCADRLNHASLIDGVILSRANFWRYPHGDITALAQHLTDKPLRTLIVTDGVFSMDGDLTPLPGLVSLSKRYQAGLLVDDAHGFGVLGRLGGGIVEHFALSQEDVPILMGTLGKAFGVFGAFIAGSEDLIELLIQKSRTFIYTTALPPAIAIATCASIKLIQTESWRREKLNSLIVRFRQGALQQGWTLLPSFTPIQALVVGEAEQALKLSQQLLTHGFLVSAIRPPTVPKGTARLRITFSASHEEIDIDKLLEALEKIKL